MQKDLQQLIHLDVVVVELLPLLLLLQKTRLDVAKELLLSQLTQHGAAAAAGALQPDGGRARLLLKIVRPGAVAAFWVGGPAALGAVEMDQSPHSDLVAAQRNP